MSKQGRRLPICYYGNPILRKRAAEIPEITDEIKQLAADMIETCRLEDGVGIAAPQVGYSLRMFVVNLSEIDAPFKEDPFVLINPELSEISDYGSVHSEGCLSIPKLYGDVLRPEKVRVKALGINGEQIDRVFEGFPARVIMHENDHINGVLFVDRMKCTKKEREDIKKQLRKIDKKYNK